MEKILRAVFKLKGDIMDNYYGNMIIIGGAEDKSSKSKILNEVLKLSKLKNGPITIVAAASQDPEKKKTIYFDTFTSLGCKDLRMLYLRNRQEAEDKEKIDEMKKSSCIFFTGGDQLKVTSIVGGTYFNKVLYECYRSGILIAGTSAGASCLCTTMIVSGKEEVPPIKCTIKMAPGLGFIGKAIIDQHFSQRGRIGRLINAVCQNPEIIGIGIDEDTAIVIRESSVIKVIGSGAVTIVDGSCITASNVSEVSPDEILAISDIKVHILSEGCSYDLNKKKPTICVSQK